MNSNLLKATIIEHGDTQTSLAEAMGILESSLSQRISGKIDFRRNEILFIKNRYNLTTDETDRIFFADVVSK